ncbi:hypothetical protein JCM8097_000976 [Rhodosporidiobolus ruineniae]
MLDRLPVKLLRLVLEQLAPLTYSVATYEPRRELLRSCSLVNRSMCRIAQSMLLEVVEVVDAADAAKLAVVVSGETRGSKVRLLVVGSEYGEPFDVHVDPGKVVRLCPNAVELRIIKVGWFCLEWLEQMSNLRHLVISGPLELSPPSPTFPSLVSLSICDAEVSSAFFSRIATPVSTPNLRSLGLASLTDYSGREFVPPALPQDLLDHLDVLSLDSTGSGPLVTAMERSPALLLDLNYNRNDSLPASLQAVRLHGDTPDPNAAQPFEDHLMRFSSSLPQLPSLAVVVLPTYLKNSRVMYKNVRLAMRQLLDALENRKIKIIWEDEADWTAESLVSPAFLRHRREETAWAKLEAAVV